MTVFLQHVLTGAGAVTYRFSGADLLDVTGTSFSINAAILERGTWTVTPELASALPVTVGNTFQFKVP